MKTDKHFRRSETYFLINFKWRPKHKAPRVGTGPETQAWDGVALAPAFRGDSANSALPGQGSGALPNGLPKPGPKPCANQNRRRSRPP